MASTDASTLLLANPRGFCAGVDRAIDVVDHLLAEYGAPIYVRKEIVHNREVVAGFRARGVVFVEELSEVPSGALVVFSAHGISPAVRDDARKRGLRVVDATCPLVTKVHLEALKFDREGVELILVGHGDHDEVVGTLGHVQGMLLVEDLDDAQTVQVKDPDKVAVITQTTLSLDDTREIIATLQRRFPNMREPARSDICYATQNRQSAVKKLAKQADVVVVVGSENSSNSQRLKDCANEYGARGYLVDDPAQIAPEWLVGATTVGVTAGASTPEGLVQRVVDRIRELTKGADVQEIGEAEPPIAFAPPPELRGENPR